MVGDNVSYEGVNFPGAVTIADGNTHNITFIHDESDNSCKLVVDGVVGNTRTKALNYDATFLRLLTRGTNSFAMNSGVAISDVYIWNRPLTDQEAVGINDLPLVLSPDYPANLPPPLVSGYKITDGNRVRMNDVETGPARFELLSQNAPMMVNVQWEFSQFRDSVLAL